MLLAHQVFGLDHDLAERGSATSATIETFEVEVSMHACVPLGFDPSAIGAKAT